MLGVGGMGVVVAATHIELGQRIAVKFLLPTLAANTEASARFLREAQAAVSLTSEHAVRVHDVGRLESGAPYMVMEYLEGKDLSEVITAEGALSVGRCVDYLLQAIDALEEAHGAGIVHRDLKPSNLFLAKRGRAQRIKVLDFGISKLSADTQSRLDLTGTSAVLGSPFYMAPEQMRSTRTVDQRADIWSLGVILYELATGRLPFQAQTLTELCLMIAQDTPVSPRSLRGDLPPELEAIVLRCLQKDPAARFANVTELASHLEALNVGYSQPTIPAPDPSVPPSDRGAGAITGPNPPAILVDTSRPPVDGASSLVNWGKSDHALPVRSGSRLWLVGGGIAIVAAAVGIALVVRSGRPSNDSRPSGNAPVMAAKSAEPKPTPSVGTASIEPIPSATVAETAEPPPSAAAPVVQPFRPAVAAPAVRPRPNVPASASASATTPTPPATAAAVSAQPAPPAASSGSTFSHDRQ